MSTNSLGGTMRGRSGLREALRRRSLSRGEESRADGSHLADKTMLREPIKKSWREATASPNLRDYQQARAEFSWEAARREREGSPGGRGLNVAHEAVDRHANDLRRDHAAIRRTRNACEVREVTYARLRNLTLVGALMPLPLAFVTTFLVATVSRPLG